jgi:hypothetical protein
LVPERRAGSRIYSASHVERGAERHTAIMEISRAQPTFQPSKIGGSITEMAIDAIRFAVGSREDVRSSVWRLWARGNDLYLAARSLAGTSKISFHQSGINRFAVNSKTARLPLISWSRPLETFPGWTVAFAILIPPHITLLPLQDVLRDNKPVQFIVPPKPGTKAIFQILLSYKTAQEEDIMRLPADKKVTVHGRIEMKRELAWLVSFYDIFTPQEQITVIDHFTKIKIHLKPGSIGNGIQTAFAHLFENGSRPFLTDIQLGRENLHISPMPGE